MENMVTEKYFDSKFNDFKEFLEEKFRNNDEGHENIMKKQDYTNGTVKDHTKEISDIKSWRYGVMAVVTALCTISGVFIYLLAMSVTTKLDSIETNIVSTATVQKLETDKKLSDMRTAIQNDMHSVAKQEAKSLLEKNVDGKINE